MVKYIIISSDDSHYIDYYQTVAKRWKILGYKTYFLHVTNEESVVENEYGIYHKIKLLENIPSSLQAQIIRLYACNLFEGIMITSDIDMLPIVKEYYSSYDDLLNDNIIVFSGQPYRELPYYPMCYIMSETKYLSNVLGITGMDFKTYCDYVIKNHGETWNTDEKFLYEKTLNTNIIIKHRTTTDRIDRSNWNYDSGRLINNEYIDSHLLKPYKEHENEIQKLIYTLKQIENNEANNFNSF